MYALPNKKTHLPWGRCSWRTRDAGRWSNLLKINQRQTQVLTTGLSLKITFLSVHKRLPLRSSQAGSLLSLRHSSRFSILTRAFSIGDLTQRWWKLWRMAARIMLVGALIAKTGEQFGDHVSHTNERIPCMIVKVQTLHGVEKGSWTMVNPSERLECSQ